METTDNREEAIYYAAVAKPASARQAFVRQACGDDRQLCHRVNTLLAAHDVQDDFLQTPVLDPDVTLDGAPVSEAPGTVIGRYKLLEKIGEGGMAVVYMAEQASPVRRKVALKIIKLGMDTKSVVARFEAERQALALMDHQSIAKVFDGGATETGRPYFVMELVKGVPITEYCDRNKLNTSQRVALFVQVCRAVQHAHQKGIIHRDIKPSNVLVTLHDGRPVPKIIDFGVAKATAEHRLTDKTLFTRFQAFIGTPAYMSPEQAQMSGLDVDTRTDIYSLGVLLYELLTSKTPFEADELLDAGLDECRRTIREKEPTRPSTRVATLIESELTATSERRQTESIRLIHSLRADLDWIVMKCLEKDRARRYETAHELAADLERYLHGDPVEARPPSTVYLVRKFIRRNKVVVAVVAVVVLAAVVSGWQAVRATRAEWEQTRLLSVAKTALQREAEQRRRAETQERAAVQRAYGSDMNLVQQALAANNNGRAVRLLDRYRPDPGQPDLRQWEWRYFWSQSRSAAAFALPRQSDAVSELALASNGRLLASRDRRGSLKLWDLASRTEVAEIATPGFGARAFAFSRDGERLAVAVQDERWRSTVKIWTVASREVGEEFPYEGGIRSLAFGPDDGRLLILGHDMAVSAWDFQTRRLQVVLSHDETQDRQRRSGTLSPDGGLLAIAEEGRICVLDTVSGLERSTMDVLEGDIASLAFSPDGSLLAAGFLFTETATHIKLFSTVSGEEVRRLVGHVSWVPSLVFTADGRRLISAGADQTVRVWDVQEGRELATLQGHLSEVYCVAAAADGKTIVSGCKDGTIFGWDADRVEGKQRFETLPRAVRGLDFTPDGRELLSVNADGTVTVWDARTLKAKETLSALGDQVTRLLIESNGARVFAGARGGALKVLDWATRLLVTELELIADRRAHVEPIGLTNGGRTLVVAGKGSTVYLVDTVSWQTDVIEDTDGMPRHFKSHQILSPDGRHLLTADFGGSIQFLDLDSGATETVATGQDWGVTDMAFSPGGELLAVSSTEGTVSLWDTETREVVDLLSGHLLGVHAVAFSPDGQRLASASQGNEAVKLWDVATRHEVASLSGEGLISTPLSFSPDGNLLVAVNGKGKAHLWRAPSLADIMVSEPARGAEQRVAVAQE